MIQAKLSQLLDSSEALTALVSKPLPISISFKLAKLVKQIDVEVKQFQETRLKRAQEMGTLSEDKTQYILSEECRSQFVEEMVKLLATECHLPGDVIKLSDLGKIELEPKHLSVLDWLIGE